MRGGLYLILPIPLLLGGCVERWLSIKSDPPGAEVYVDGVKVGETPIRVPFEFYGDREILLRKERYETMRRVEGIHAPWWQIFPFDFFTDVLLPFSFEDGHELTYTLAPLGPAETPERVQQRAQELKNRLEQKKP
jgi:hypothetical protein